MWPVIINGFGILLLYVKCLCAPARCVCVRVFVYYMLNVCVVILSSQPQSRDQKYPRVHEITGNFRRYRITRYVRGFINQVCTRVY